MYAAQYILLALVATLFLGCSDATEPSPPVPGGPRVTNPTASLLITPASATLQTGESRQFTATATGTAALGAGHATVGWTSTNEQVATVSPTGRVLALSGGTAQIVAVWGTVRATALVTVVGAWKKSESPPVCLKRPQPARDLIASC